MTDRSPLAGQPADPATLIDVPALLRAYHDIAPDPTEPTQRVAFGTSGHRGSAFRAAFNEAHIVAISAAICRYRRAQGYDGPMFLARDTHALSEPATRTAVEVLVADGVDVRVDAADGFTPTPALSHAVILANRDVPANGPGLADGIVVTPSHNPPDDGGFKYNPPNGGPADTAVTTWIQDEANRILAASGSDGLAGIRRVPYETALGRTTPHDFLGTYVDDLPNVVDLAAVAASGLRIGVDPMGGASVAYWAAIAERHGLDITVTNTAVDPTFGFMTLRLGRQDPDGPVVALRDGPAGGPARSVRPGARQRRGRGSSWRGHARRRAARSRTTSWPPPSPTCSAGARAWGPNVGVGKTLVSSSIIDRVVADLGRRLVEVPVGFKWFVDGLVDGSIGFGGEESAGASFLRRDGTVWTTDKDGIIADLLACELTARLGHDPGVAYAGLTERFGAPVYRRVDAPATRATEGRAGAPVTGGRDRHDTGRRPDHGHPDHGARQRRSDRRAQGRHGPGLVRGAAVRHGGRGQGLCRVVPGRDPPGAAPRRGAGRGGGGHGGLSCPPGPRAALAPPAPGRFLANSSASSAIRGCGGWDPGIESCGCWRARDPAR